jgi:hypothetical protein
MEFEQLRHSSSHGRSYAALLTMDDGRFWSNTSGFAGWGETDSF